MAETAHIETISEKIQEQTAEIRFPRRTFARIDALAKRTDSSVIFTTMCLLLRLSESGTEKPCTDDVYDGQYKSKYAI